MGRNLLASDGSFPGVSIVPLQLGLSPGLRTFLALGAVVEETQ